MYFQVSEQCLQDDFIHVNKVNKVLNNIRVCFWSLYPFLRNTQEIVSNDDLGAWKDLRLVDFCFCLCVLLCRLHF